MKRMLVYLGRKAGVKTKDEGCRKSGSAKTSSERASSEAGTRREGGPELEPRLSVKPTLFIPSVSPEMRVLKTECGTHTTPKGGSRSLKVKLRV